METLVLFGPLAFSMVVVVAWVAAYNHLTRLRNVVRQAAGTLAAQLHQRHDLVPDMADAARESVEVQREYLGQVLESRERIMGVSQNPSSGDVGQARRGPLIAGESNPQMSVETYVQAQKVQAATEEDIAAARRFLQAAVAEYNSAIESFPMSIVASMSNFQPYDFYSISEEIAAKPDVWLTRRSS